MFRTTAFIGSIPFKIAYVRKSDVLLNTLSRMQFITWLFDVSFKKIFRNN